MADHIEFYGIKWKPTALFLITVLIASLSEK